MQWYECPIERQHLKELIEAPRSADIARYGAVVQGRCYREGIKVSSDRISALS
ncbi:MAG: hypothetical protein V7L01_15040 [Nostoc sp.]|uniref:hypothetical protein n=1 Tax=Nostoc sp. TaxID=1180 RepID=UPI002FF511AC